VPEGTFGRSQRPSELVEVLQVAFVERFFHFDDGRGDCRARGIDDHAAELIGGEDDTGRGSD